MVCILMSKLQHPPLERQVGGTRPIHGTRIVIHVCMVQAGFVRCRVAIVSLSCGFHNMAFRTHMFSCGFDVPPDGCAL